MMIKFGLSALVAAGMLVSGLSAGSASAADLGGNCCADLEERISELEATTARKGNRRVSLTISGWVGEQVMWWDDGNESNVYVGGLGTTLASHFKMTGQATIMPGWHAGYVIQVEVFGSETLAKTNQNIASGPSFYNVSTGVGPFEANRAFRMPNTLQSYWFMKSDRMGKIGIGLQSQASDNTAILPDGSGSLVPANYVAFDYLGFLIRDGNGNFGPSWGGASGCSDCNGLTTNNIRYDSPTWHGFSVSASWGEDDFWDVAARYAGEHHGFKFSVAGAYSESVDAGDAVTFLGGFVSTPNPVPDGFGVQADNTQFFQIGAYAEHVHSGLWLYGAYGKLQVLDSVPGFSDDLNNFYYIKGGLRRRWHPLGHTVMYVEYEKFDNDAALSEVKLWGVGIVQEIDAAAMSMWLTYRHLEADFSYNTVDPFTGFNPNTADDFDYVKFGALINF
jgi:hypothetical protein